MWHGAGHRKAAGDCGPCDRHVRSGAESPQDSARSFENARISSGDSRSEQKLGACSVDIKYTIRFSAVILIRYFCSQCPFYLITDNDVRCVKPWLSVSPKS